jgi:hypothetical protein
VDPDPGHSTQAAIAPADNAAPAAAATTAFEKPRFRIPMYLYPRSLVPAPRPGVPARGALHLALSVKARNCAEKEH